MKTLVLLLLTFFSISLCSQNNWAELISSSDNLYEIQEKAKVYFAERGTGKGSGYKQYMRWMGQTQMLVNRDGIIRNTSVLNSKGLKERDKIFNFSNRSTNGDWENLGPFDYFGGDTWSGGGLGRINCMAFHPLDSNTFYAGAPAGGLWKTEDNGETWTPLTDGLPSIGVSEIIIHPTKPDTMYMLTGDGDGGDTPGIGVLKSHDAGISWEETAYKFDVNQLNRAYRMVMHPDSLDQMIIGLSNGGIVRTNDAFETFSTSLSGITVWDIEYAPNHPDTVYAATSNGFYKSLDAGLTWTLDTISGLPILPAMSYPRMAIAVSPSLDSSVYVVVAGVNGPGLFNGVFKSTDFGASFTMQSNSPNILGWSTNGSDSTNQAGYDLTILVHPENDATVFVGGVNMWKSNDNGATWGRETWWTKNFEPFDPYVHADWHNMYYHDDYLYACVDGGISRSNDEGNDWSEISKNLCIMQFYEIALNGNQYMGGAQDNGINRTEFDNQTGHNILGGDGFGCTWHYGNTSIQYLSNQSAIVRRQAENNVFIWNLTNGFWFNILKMHTTDPDYFFVSQDNNLFRASQNAAIWDFNWDSLGTNAFLPLFPNTGGKEILGYSQGKGENDDVMYLLGTGNKILKTSNLSESPPTWDSIPDPTPANVVLSDIIQSPTDTNMVWMTCSGYSSGNKVFSSIDGGSTWTNISGSLPNVPVKCITYQEGSSDVIYIGTPVGVFYRSTAMPDWSYFGNGLPNVPIDDLKVHDGFLYAGTYGRGIWRTEIFSPCPFSLILTPANDPMHPGTEVVNVLDNLTSTRIIENNLGRNVSYLAENFIELLPGFRAKKGSVFLSNVDDCPD
jgi:photosystem II stability/assembly factor-like uncharacterized protein